MTGGPRRETAAVAELDDTNKSSKAGGEIAATVGQRTARIVSTKEVMARTAESAARRKPSATSGVATNPNQNTGSGNNESAPAPSYVRSRLSMTMYPPPIQPARADSEEVR